MGKMKGESNVAERISIFKIAREEARETSRTRILDLEKTKT